MKADSPLKHFAIAFGIALLCYILFYWGIEHRRNRNGPWQVTFTQAESRIPEIIINQSRLGATNIHLLFTDESPVASNPPVMLNFKEPKPVPYDVPFGKCIFMDSTFLPGTLTFQLFGHEIELLPRVLIIDHKEYPWVANQTISLSRLTNSVR